MQFCGLCQTCTHRLQNTLCMRRHAPCSYVKKPYDKAGTALKLVVRGKANDATVTKMPFVKTTYFKG